MEQAATDISYIHIQSSCLQMNEQQRGDRPSNPIVELGEVEAGCVDQSEPLNDPINQPSLLLGRHGLFLGRWEPASEFKLPCYFRFCCCSCIYCCCPAMKKSRVTPAQGVWYLAMIQVIVGIFGLTFSLVSLMWGTSKDWDLTDYLGDVALGYWAMYGAEFCEVGPVDKFSFAQFILALKAAVKVPLVTVFLAFGGLGAETTDTFNVIIAMIGGVYYIYSAAYKLYYSYIAWSFCYGILSAPEEMDAANPNHAAEIGASCEAPSAV